MQEGSLVKWTLFWTMAVGGKFGTPAFGQTSQEKLLPLPSYVSKHWRHSHDEVTTCTKCTFTGSQLELRQLRGNLNTSAFAFHTSVVKPAVHLTPYHTRHRGSREPMKAMCTNRTHSFLAETTGILESCATLFPQMLNIWPNMTNSVPLTQPTALPWEPWCHYLKTHDVWGK